MHILHLTPYYAPAYPFGGVTRACEGMTRALVERGHRVTVLTTDALSQTTRYDGPADEIRDGVRVIRARNASVWLRGRANLSTPFAMRDLATRLLADVDVVHCHEFRTLENLLVTPIATKMGVPMVLSPHGTLTPGTGRSTLKSAWDRLLSPSVARRFDTVIGLTDHERDEAAQLWRTFGADSRFTFVPNGVDPSEFTSLPDPSAFRQQWELHDGPTVLFMGRLHPRKGAALLAHVFTTINLPDANLVIAGTDEGDRPALEVIAATDPRIVLTGYLDGEARLAALATADLFALPAVGEGLPMTALEAMAAGVPALLSPECHLPQVAEAGAGRIADVDEGAISKALRDLLSDEALRSEMSTNARQLVADHFTWGAVAERLEHIYSGLTVDRKD
jgi:glycosyltransferase involved in cell wall biosynthesis